jgi:hypothetical protein
MVDKDLHDLVRRRMWELARTAEDAARLWRTLTTPEIRARMAQRGDKSFLSDVLVEFLARTLDVPENRIRRAVGLPKVPDERESISTRPHLRVLRNHE